MYGGAGHTASDVSSGDIPVESPSAADYALEKTLANGGSVVNAAKAFAEHFEHPALDAVDCEIKDRAPFKKEFSSGEKLVLEMDAKVRRQVDCEFFDFKGLVVAWPNEPQASRPVYCGAAMFQGSATATSPPPKNVSILCRATIPPDTRGRFNVAYVIFGRASRHKPYLVLARKVVEMHF